MPRRGVEKRKTTKERGGDNMASSKNIHVEIHDGTEHFKEQLEQKMPSILKAIGQTAEGYAKEDCP